MGEWVGRTVEAKVQTKYFFLKCDSEWKKIGQNYNSLRRWDELSIVWPVVGGLGDLFLETSERKLTHADKPLSKCFWKCM